jgi:hypothetical protein
MRVKKVQKILNDLSVWLSSQRPSSVTDNSHATHHEKDRSRMRSRNSFETLKRFWQEICWSNRTTEFLSITAASADEAFGTEYQAFAPIERRGDT